MKVSVIVPVYGVEKYLNACVESIVSQTYRDLEIFLVDDGGKDGCPQMCDDWANKDDRILVIHKENGGQGTARNAALDRVSGDYILFVDSDDTIQPTMIEDMVAASDGGRHDVVLSGLVFDSGLTKQMGLWYDTDRIFQNYELMKEYVSTPNIFTGPTGKLFRSRVFETLRFPNFRANEDAFVMHHLFGECASAAVLAKNNYNVTIRPDSTEGSPFNVHKMHLLDCANDLKAYIIANYPDLRCYSDFKPIDHILSLLRKIYIGKLERVYPNEVAQLREALENELRELSSRYDSNPYREEAELFLHHEKKYARIQGKKRFVRRAKGFAKRILMCLKK